MSFRLNQCDRRILATVADYRVIGTNQLATALERNAHALRRRLRALVEHGFITTTSGDLTGRRGRPEQLMALGNAGIELLKTEETIDPQIPDEYLSAPLIRCLGHQLMVNEFRLQLLLMERAMPELTVRFIGPDSPFTEYRLSGHSLIREQFVVGDGPGTQIRFVPDGVLSVAHAALNRTLLFFLEADRGTESLNSPRNHRRDVRQKIVNYRMLFQTRRYLRYETLWGCRLHGFRVLFVANTPARLASLCRLVQGVPPADFVWLTDQETIQASGLWGPIWARGGTLDGSFDSILGSRMPQ